MAIILLIVCLAIGGAMSVRLERSSGGTPTLIENASFFASIKKNNVHKCGGALITQRHVLSVAICVVDTWNRLDYENVVITGSDRKYGGGTMHRIASMVALQENLQRILPNDLVVLELSSNVVDDLEDSFFTFPPIGPPSFYAPAEFFAFESAKDKKKNTFLHKMGILVNNDGSKYGNAVARRISPKMFRGFQGYGHSRQEDTGGPLVQNGKLIGIASTTVKPAVSSRDFIWIYEFRDRLKQLIPTVVILE